MSIILLVACLAATASAVGNREAIYVGGNVNPVYQRGDTKSFRPGYYGVKVSGRIDTSSESELVFDAGHRGALAIPYGAILWFKYSTGGVFEDLVERHRNRVSERAGLPLRHTRTSPYPWSDDFHGGEHFYLGLELQNDAGNPGDVIFELGQDIVRPTIEAIERRTGQEVALTSVRACAAYRGREACGWGDLAELKGRTRVFIHPCATYPGRVCEWSDLAELKTMSKDPARIPAESDVLAELDVLREKITADIEAVIEKARIGVTVVKGPEDADIILVFRFFKGQSGKSGWPEEAAGEVYVAEGARLRVLMLFDEERKFLRRGPVRRFAEEFVSAYKNANDLK